MNRVHLLIFGTFAVFSFAMHFSTGCNEAVCASIVSKCMITQSCKCDLRNCSCCKDCFTCLNNLYSECCSCVDMCPKPNHTTSALSKKSHVEDLPEPIPTLFQSLVLEPDSLDRWFILTFPVDIDTRNFKPDAIKPVTYTNEQEVDPIKDNMITLNCSVAYMSQCMSWNKCKVACRSMGANSYRWFHNGCCECVGDKCLHYGIGESRCSQCPLQREVMEPDSIASDYGEDDEDVNPVNMTSKFI